MVDCPITEPKVSSVTVSMNESESTAGSGDSDEDDDDDDNSVGDGAVLLRCCGEDRPRDKKASIVVAALAGGSNAGYVTIRDFVSVVHPWLMGLKGGVLGAIGCRLDLGAPLGASAELAVNCIFAKQLSTSDSKDRWFRVGP